MLISFSVSNFLSFKDKVTLSLEKAAIRKHPEHIIGGKYLSGATLYGANASGKTNLLEALNMLASCIRPDSFTDMLRMNTFLMRPEASIEFEADFISNQTRYSYKITVSSEEITDEELFFSTSENVRELIFKRKGVEKKFGPLYEKEDWYKHRSFPKNVTLLSKLLSDGIVDNDVKNKEHIVNVAEFFRTIILFNHQTEIQPAAVYNRLQMEEFHKFILDLMKRADVGITDIEFKPIDNIPQESVARDPELSKLVPGAILCRSINNEYVFFAIEKGKVNGRRLALKHGEVSFGLAQESAGTVKLFKLGFALYARKIVKNSLLLIDEFDGMFHPSLAKVLLQSLLENHSDGQIIVTLHNTMLLSHEIWRVDEIWFTEKNSAGESRLYPLTDINPRFDSVLEKDYIKGKYGAVPFLGGEAQWKNIIK